MPSHVASRRSLTQRLLIPLLSAGVLAFGAPAALASNTLNTLWDLTYPSSASNNVVVCALCHDQTSPSRTDLPIRTNDYGIALQNNPNIASNPTLAFEQVEPLNSDSDPGGYTNLEEINLGTQPGWTVGDTVPFSSTVLLDPNGDEPPVADAGANVTGTVGETIQFDGSGSTDDGTIVDYAWTFGDGGTETVTSFLTLTALPAPIRSP